MEIVHCSLSILNYMQRTRIGLSRYIAITNLPIIAVFVEYLRQFLIDLNQTYRHSSVVSVNFLSFLAPAVSQHGATATFLSWCASHGVANSPGALGLTKEKIPNKLNFYRASAVAASPVLATIGMSVRLSVRPSVRPSVCLSITR